MPINSSKEGKEIHPTHFSDSLVFQSENKEKVEEAKLNLITIASIA